MKPKFMLFLVVGVFSFVWTFAEEQSESKLVPKVTNETYKTNCGKCHFTYQPGLLPARSWSKIVDTPDGHAGGKLVLEDTAKTEVGKYLAENSAENSRSRRSRKILASLIDGNIPIRITDIPYIKQKHDEIKPEVFSRKSIKSKGNCIACHKTAADGDYSDTNAIVPE